MPIYEYKCPACYYKTEEIQSFDATEVPVCPNRVAGINDHLTMHRIVSVPNPAIVKLGTHAQKLFKR
jgi:putative FmdB family regulatory protein